jgi:hypothetical protein
MHPRLHPPGRNFWSANISQVAGSLQPGDAQKLTLTESPNLGLQFGSKFRPNPRQNPRLTPRSNLKLSDVEPSSRGIASLSGG